MSNITNLEKCTIGNGTQWYWMHEGVRYKTNKEGEGIWKYEDTNWHYFVKRKNGQEYMKTLKEWKQIDGTCDFWLRDMTPSGARQKLNRHFNEKY